MRAFDRRRSLKVAVLAVAATAGTALAAGPAQAVSFPNACKNNVNANNVQIDVTDLTGTAPASVTPNTAFGLTGISQKVSLPGNIFVVGYNLGLVHNGDTVTGTVQDVIDGTNTTQATQTTPTQSVLVGPIVIHDPDGMPGTGDETADPVVVPVSFADQAWTSGPSEGTIDFREHPDPTLTGTSGGGMIIKATIPPLTVQFHCSPGTVTGPDPGVVSFLGSAPSFATSAISLAAPPPPPPTVPVPPATGGGGTGTGAASNAFSFGKVTTNKTSGTATLSVKVPGAGALVLAKTANVSRNAKKATKAGTVKLVVKARGKALKKLRRTGKVTVKALVSFTPTGGTKRTKTKNVKLVKTKRSARHTASLLGRASG